MPLTQQALCCLMHEAHMSLELQQSPRTVPPAVHATAFCTWTWSDPLPQKASMLVFSHAHAILAVLQVRQLFEELVVPFVCGHEGVASVLLGGSKATGAALQEEAQQKLWQVCVVFV